MFKIKEIISAFMNSQYHVLNSPNIFFESIKPLQTFGVFMCKAGKTAEHWFCLDFFVTFCVKTKRKTIVRKPPSPISQPAGIYFRWPI